MVLVCVEVIIWQRLKTYTTAISTRANWKDWRADRSSVSRPRSSAKRGWAWKKRLTFIRTHVRMITKTEYGRIALVIDKLHYPFRFDVIKENGVLNLIHEQYWILKRIFSAGVTSRRDRPEHCDTHMTLHERRNLHQGSSLCKRMFVFRCSGSLSVTARETGPNSFDKEVNDRWLIAATGRKKIPAEIIFLFFRMKFSIRA